MNKEVLKLRKKIKNCLKNMAFIQQERADKAFELSEEDDDELLRLFDLNAQAAQAAENRLYELKRQEQ